MKIDYSSIDLKELDRLYFLHINNFNFICDADKKQIILIKKDSEE